MLRAPGRNADAVAEIAVGLLFAVTRGISRADLDVRDGETYRDGTIPYQRFRAWQLAGQTAGIVGLGAVGRAAAWRFEGLGMTRRSPTTRTPPTPPTRSTTCSPKPTSSRCTRRSPPRSHGHDRRRAVRPHARRRDLPQHRAGPVLHDTDALVGALADGHLGGAGLDHFVGEHLAVDHPLCSMANVVLTPHIGGATYDTETNHSTLIADGLVGCSTAARRPTW